MTEYRGLSAPQACFDLAEAGLRGTLIYCALPSGGAYEFWRLDLDDRECIPLPARPPATELVASYNRLHKLLMTTYDGQHEDDLRQACYRLLGPAQKDRGWTDARIVRHPVEPGLVLEYSLIDAGLLPTAEQARAAAEAEAAKLAEVRKRRHATYQAKRDVLRDLVNERVEGVLHGGNKV